jgi:DNA-binding transcriptional ArsR family regulator
MADIFDVLADGTRRELLSLLRRRGGEVSVTELVAELGISQPTVSKHLKVLREAGLVEVREEGQHRYYRLDTVPLA